MKRMTTALSAVVLVLALAMTSAGPVSADNDDGRRYVAVSHGSSIVQPPEECDATGFPIVVCEQTTSATVRGTPVGRGQSSGEGQITLDFSQECVGSDGSAGTPFSSTQEVVTVARRGGELHTTTVTNGCFVEFGVPSRLRGSFTIDGGTGRFADATGGGAVFGRVNGDRFFSIAWGRISLDD